MLPEAYERGRETAFDGLALDANPYPAGSKESERWLEGWQDGMSELGLDSGPMCCICARPITGLGHNADPVAEGRCCDGCNARVVIPTRRKGANG
jgi:ribosome modulation factor